MKPQLFANLVKAIDKWIEANCEESEWPDVVMGDDTSLLMAKAAASVLDAIAESQKYAVEQGYLKAK